MFTSISVLRPSNVQFLLQNLRCIDRPLLAIVALAARPLAMPPALRPQQAVSGATGKDRSLKW